MPTLTRGSLIFDAVVIAQSGTAVSEAIDMSKADALALHLTAITGTNPSVTFTYSLSCDGTTYTTPQSPVTIGATKAAVDVMDFAPEAANWIKITATNNNAGAAVTITANLAIQEKH
jgi:hypothetical protein